MADAMTGLVEANLEEGRARYSSGDREGAEEHLALARTFGATAEQLRQARRMGREAMPAPKPKRTPAAEGPVGDDPIWSLPPDDPRLRYALMVETYPAHLRERLMALGPAFAEAALLTDNGQPERALKRSLTTSTPMTWRAMSAHAPPSQRGSCPPQPRSFFALEKPSVTRPSARTTPPS